MMLSDRISTGNDRRNLKLNTMVAILLSALLISTLPAAAQYSLTMNMTAFTPTHQDQLFKLRVVRVSDNTELGEFVIPKIVVGEFGTTFNNILEAGETYNIDAFADFNQNELYDPPPVDHAWRIVLSNVTGNTVVELRHTPTWTDIQYPNPGSGGENPDTVVTEMCSCDLNGDGDANVMDLLEWLQQVRDGADNLCLDYNQDGKLAISDLVSLMVAIRNGGCM